MRTGPHLNSLAYKQSMEELLAKGLWKQVTGRSQNSRWSVLRILIVPIDIRWGVKVLTTNPRSPVRVGPSAPIHFNILTYQDRFFEKLGFQLVDKDLFPRKLMWECLECPKLEHCDERAYLKDLNRKRAS